MYLEVSNFYIASQVHPLECVPKIKPILAIIFQAIHYYCIYRWTKGYSIHM